MFDVLVIGSGLFGTAAARYLSRAGARVGVLGPDEPSDYAGHNGVFASHYDTSRIFNVLDQNEVWAQLAKRSIETYQWLEQESGVSFLRRDGLLRVGWDEGIYHDLIVQSAQMHVPCYESDVAHAKLNYPYLQFNEQSNCLFESDGGYLNPRLLIAAQLACTNAEGLTRIKDTAFEVKSLPDRVEVRTQSGNVYHAGRLLLTTGSFTNSFALTRHILDLEVRPHTVLLIPVNRTEWAVLQDMPAVWYQFQWHSRFSHAYLVPPAVYPDGRMYLKIWADYDRNVAFNDLAAYQRFFQEMGSEETGQALREIVPRIIPEMKGRRGILKPCISTHTPSGYPMIDQVEGRIFVAIGGCGHGARAADEIGRMAASLVEYRGWHHDLPAKYFRASFGKKRAFIS